MSDPTPATPATPTFDTASPWGFIGYLITSELSDPLAKAQVGGTIRHVLQFLAGATGFFGFAGAAGWMGRMSDWTAGISMLSAAIISVSAYLWNRYQKFRVDRKLAHKNELIASLARPLPAKAEIKTETKQL